MAAPSGAPVFFERNRVARVYRGGRLFGEFFGDPPEDGFLPEEWIASTVRALNREVSDPDEGISVIEGSRTRFTTYLGGNPAALGGRAELGILVKVLDSAIRLPVQAHPNKQFARRHFASAHGKTEMWIVLGTRPGASIYFGFRERVSRARFAEAVAASEHDRSAMPSLLNVVPARRGDMYLIPPRVVHAIGAGCLILEVQEPTDYTLQPEAWCGDYRLDEREKYLGLDPETAIECFDFQDLVGEKAIQRGRIEPGVAKETGEARLEELVGERQTPDFAVNRIRVREGSHKLRAGPAVYVVTSGSGELAWQDHRRPLGVGSYFFLPADVGQVHAASGGEIVIVECLPPGGGGGGGS